MPIYEYKCLACGVREERLEGIAAPVTHDCLTCGEVEGMNRQLSMASVSTSGGPDPSYGSAPSCMGGSCPFMKG